MDSAPRKTQKMTKTMTTMANCFRKIIFRFSITKGKWPLPVQENPDHMGKNGCQKRILHPKKHKKQSFFSRGNFIFFCSDIGEDASNLPPNKSPKETLAEHQSTKGTTSTNKLKRVKSKTLIDKPVSIGTLNYTERSTS